MFPARGCSPPVLAVHISDGVMQHSWELAGFVLLAAILAWSAAGLADAELPRLAIVGASFFVGSLIHIPLGPTSVHLLLNGVAGFVLGRRAPLAIVCGLFLQVLLLHHGGWLTFGLNGSILSVPALLLAAVVRHWPRSGSRYRRIAPTVLGAFAALATVSLDALVLGLGGIADFSTLVRLVVVAHVPLMAIEGCMLGAIAPWIIAEREAAIASSQSNIDDII